MGVPKVRHQYTTRGHHLNANSSAHLNARVQEAGSHNRILYMHFT